MQKQFALAAGAMLLISSVQASEWGYEGQSGPEHWGDIAPECSLGKNQSPIDITRSVEADLSPLTVNYTGNLVSLTNNGHTLEAHVEGDNSFTINDNTFTLKQFHFHTPSENLIHGKQFPLEAHFVHADSKNNLAVIALMFDVGEANPQIASLISTLPAKGDTITFDQSFPVSAWLPRIGEDYYRFSGSLTTPPCSEGVRWFVLQNNKDLSQAQVDALHKAMGDNNRPIQPLNARLVLDAD